ncbi:uncharacterized protein LOC106142359 [Amyelois transitella]|uniref:uncharacterized protein LOC106142359 n=1 Tax=Amyelois transitella TaxID=680683 RepID=UPI00067CAC3F|nr:uncharacterized protein LOC106142359 [Amyelois transitella]
MKSTEIASWKTKEDVLQDLGAFGQMGNVDNYLVIGNRPPPPLREDLGDEYNIPFDSTSYENKSMKPDLKGITHFIRMLNDEEDPSEEETKQGTSAGIVISKLNPLVKEFVPRTRHSNSLSVGITANNNCLNNPSKSRPNTNSSSKLSHKNDKKPAKSMTSVASSSNTTNSTSQNGNAVISDQDINVGATSNDIVQLTNELRNKISNTLKSDSLKHKKERNVAIANLLRLHSLKPSPCSSKPSRSSSKSNISTSVEGKEPTLITPDYFKHTINDPPIASSSCSEKADNEAKSETDTERIENGEQANTVHPSIQESIEKVNNWFEKPKSAIKKAPSVCLGPVSFKRKDASVQSPTGDVDSKSTKTITPTAQFKPSKYAEDLAKKYMERKQEAKRRQMTIWDNLEDELKKKDEVIRNKRAANTDD